DDPAASAGLAFLRERQHNGTWDEPEFTGTGFPRDFYINYHLYRHLFPLMALAAQELPPERAAGVDQSAVATASNGHHPVVRDTRQPHEAAPAPPTPVRS